MSGADFEGPLDLELLAGRVLGDLSDEESDRFESTISQDASAGELLWELEKASAGFQLASLRREIEPMPGDVAERLRVEGRRHVGKPNVEVRFGDRVIDAAIGPAAESDPARPDSPRRPVAGVSGREWIAWMCAAAAMMIAVSFWRAGTEAKVPSAVEARAELVQGSDSLIRADWTAGKTPFAQPVLGDVVWDEAAQKGFMRFRNMPINDPAVEQYQLWIIDPQRDDEPIDGGVFDITEEGEVVVEIDAKLRVIQPAAFAITIEKPGGVVVSTQERLPLLAAVSG
jgi:anti-sigma-K factor RskA